MVFSLHNTFDFVFELNLSLIVSFNEVFSLETFKNPD